MTKGIAVDETTPSQPTPADRAMADILATLEEFFEGRQSPELTLGAICQISGRYKMESI